MTDKRTLRERIWDELEDEGIARFPYPPHDRIPNFVGASEAADRLTELREWGDATTIKANPDAPQLPVRRRALREGKTVYMAVPRLRDERCFVELDPSRIDDTDSAATVSGMDEHGQKVGPADVPSIDLIVSGSVAVTQTGGRIGKGEGYSDLEYAVLQELDLVSDQTPVVTTVHGKQIVDDDVPLVSYDVPIDIIVTPKQTIRTDTTHDKPSGLYWSDLSEERIEEIPVLQRLRE
jgi:5-formyltetrahydrofolate cyclo-ligase